MPGPVGSTIGIVGGLIIGQVAVSASLVSPMVVVVVALTALGDFAIPSEELSEAIRLVKYLMLFLCAWFGILGFFLGLVFLLAHLAGLKSFGVSYLAPYSAWKLNRGDRPEGQPGPFSVDLFETAAAFCTGRQAGTERKGAIRMFSENGKISRRQLCLPSDTGFFRERSASSACLCGGNRAAGNLSCVFSRYFFWCSHTGGWWRSLEKAVKVISGFLQNGSLEKRRQTFFCFSFFCMLSGI